jgi:hypothetical protein
MMERETMPDEQTEDEAEQPVSDIPTPLPADAFTALFDLLTLAIDPRAVKVRLLGLHRALVATDEVEKKLAARSAAFAAHETSVCAEFAAREAEVSARELRNYTAEQGLLRRESALLADRDDINREDRILKRRAMALGHVTIPNEALQDFPSWRQLLEELAGASVNLNPDESEMESSTHVLDDAPSHLSVRQTTFRRVPRSTARRVQADI